MQPERLYWNDGWQFTPRFTEELLGPSGKPEGLTPVRLPHSCAETPFSYFTQAEYEMVCGYQKCFEADAAWRGKKVLLTFEAVAHSAEVYLNGQKVGEHKSGYTAFCVPLHGALRFDAPNVLAVKVDSRESQNIPPFGNVIDYMTYGGIYREAYIEVKNQVYIEDVFVKAPAPDAGSAVLVSKISLNARPPEGAALGQTLRDARGKVLARWQQPVQGADVRVEQPVQDVQAWSGETPVLYTLQTELLVVGQPVDSNEVRFGFRTIQFNADGLYLNGEKQRLRGLNRHQSWPYTGYAMPARAQRNDADILKYELGLNAVRTSHYPQSHHFINRCDELGLLVFTELPGWQHIGDEEWQQIACQSVEEMVRQYCNHPSIILWGVRINESQDNDAFYTKTNAIAHGLDDTRPTSGVRFLQKSSLLEDVYAYNDFIHTGKNRGVDTKQAVSPDMQKGYLVSEYNGHMYPTKSFDDEPHRLEHALRHARVMQGYYAQPDIAGGFGWCMFDYNTHKDFGSGDGICYHGVLDMFRNPKLAAAVYKSQQEKEPVLEISSAMDIGDHPGGNIGTVYAFTNADAVRLYKNNVFIRQFAPDRQSFGALPHPPVAIDDFVGVQLEEAEGFSPKAAAAIKQVFSAIQRYGQNDMPVRYRLKMLGVMLQQKLTIEKGIALYLKYMTAWGDKMTEYRFEAVKDDRVVQSVTKAAATGVHLQAQADTTRLCETASWDVASVRITARDANGNLLPYFNEPVKLRLEGRAALIGPDTISLKGGMGGTFVKTTGEKGSAGLTILCGSLPPVQLDFTLQ